ncbi:MAG TPA: UDP-N-acetylmuramoyl-L-alanyl-D-glutamate--2,6-diaminopimelate ligase [Verrucomicrobiae bacterium]|jgi:UDP-N-acetylmuramoyl-L-alanyl-D-glutamate--2,6-diaminopimelate ligase
MQLSELLAHLKVLATEGPLNCDVTGLTYDSRRVTPGMVFVAVPGQNTDGHEHISSAIDRGASAVICERNGFVTHRSTKVKVRDSREALALAAAVFHGHPATRLKMIGITGTNGKTTVSFMVKHILETAGVRSGLMGTVRYEVGERVVPAHRTTPEALEVQQMLASMLRADCAACVMEVSSHALDQKRVFGIDFDVAIFTNLTQDHLDFHGTMENYFQAKKRLFTSAYLEAKHGAAVINGDDPFGARLLQEANVEVNLSFGLDESARLRATQVKLGREKTQFNVETPAGCFPCALPLIGRHNIYNTLAAVGAAITLKIDLSVIREALQSMPPVPGRLESIDRGQPFSVFVDYAHTDDALRNVLQTLREVTKGRILLAFGCGGSRDTGKRAKMGKVAAELAGFTIITSDNPRKETPEKIAAQIEEGYRSVRQDNYRIELDRRRAIDEILREARRGDVVLLAGKGHETYQEFQDTVVPFDDRVYAAETLETLGFKEMANA